MFRFWAFTGVAAGAAHRHHGVSVWATGVLGMLLVLACDIEPPRTVSDADSDAGSDAGEDGADQPSARPFVDTMRGLQGQPTAASVVRWHDLVAAADDAAPAAEQRVLPALEIPSALPLPWEDREDLPVVAKVAMALEPAPDIPIATAPTAVQGFAALGDNNGSIPPDTHGAVGPRHLMTTLNTQVRIQDRNGGIVSTVSLEAFWASADAPDVFDPKVVYDPFAGRWFFTACGNPRSATSSILIAVSWTDDPTGTWNIFRIDGDSSNLRWIDYPSIGFNKQWIVVNANTFSVAADSFVDTRIWAFNKAALTRTDGIATSDHRLFAITDQGGTLVPAITYSDTLSTLYLLAHYSGNSGGSGYLRIYSITGEVGAEAFNVGVTIGTPNPWAFSTPTGDDLAQQLGSAQRIDTGDARIQNVVYRNGSLWTTHTVMLPAALPTRSAVQWWQILPSGTTSPTGVVQQRGRVDDATGAISYFYPSLAVNRDDSMLVGYSRSSATQYASASHSFRMKSDPVNTLRGDTLLKAGLAPYFKTFSGASNRWGDYSATLVDAVDDCALWTIQEYAELPAGGYDRWGTWWGKIVAPNTQPTLDAIASPARISEDGGLQTLVLRGISSGAAICDATQTVVIGAASDNASLIPDPVASAPSGSTATLSYTPLADANGSANITVTASDDGGTANGGQNAIARAFTIIVSEVNDAPLPVADSATTSEDAAKTVAASDLIDNDGEGATNESGQTLTLVAVATPSSQGGAVSLAGGTVTYTPAANFNGSDTFNYTTRDDGTTNGTADPRSSVGVVTVIVTEVNDPPQANPDGASTPEDSPRDIAVSLLAGNDAAGPANESGQTLTVSAVSGTSAQGGVVTLVGGVVTYTPAPDFTGSDSFTYLIGDNGTTNGVADPKASTGTVSVTVTAVNDAPVAVDDALTSAEDVATIITGATLTGNDSKGPANESGQSLTVIAVSATSSQGGTVTLVANTVTYTPPANYSGNDSFSYTTRDNGTTNGVADPKQSVGTVNITVTALNDAPVTVADAATTEEDHATTIVATSLADNDSPGPDDESGETLVVGAVSAVSAHGGTVTLVAGTVTYTPAANFNGVDSFSYTLTDNGTSNGVADPRSSSGTVTVTVSEVNDAPAPAADSAMTPEDSAKDITLAVLLANDSRGAPNESGQTLTLSDISSASLQGGTVTWVGGTVTYIPPAQFHGSDSFTYSVTDDGTTNGGADPRSSDAVTVTVTVTEVNDAPSAGADAASSDEDSAKTIAGSLLVGNDSRGPADESGQTLTVIAVSPTSAQGGTVTLSGGEVTYLPPADFNGADSFTYTVSDDGVSDGLADPKTALGTVSVTVRDVNDAPSPGPDSATTAEGDALELTVSGLTANDTVGPADESGQTFTVTAIAVTSAHGGSVVVVGDTVTYTPAADFFGVDSFTYSIADDGMSNGGADPKSATGTVTITVTDVNDAPVATSDAASSAEDTPTILTASELTGNDAKGPANESDQHLTVSAVSATSAQGGTVIVAAGLITYTPAPDFHGDDSFTYTVTDDGTTSGTADPLSATGTVSISVWEVNDAPVSSGDGAATTEDVALIIPAGELTLNDSSGPSDESGQTLTVSAVANISAQGGTVTLSAGTVTYTPAASFNGSDSFDYTVTDDGATNGSADPRSRTGTVSVTVSEVNDPPVALADATSTVEDIAKDIAVSVLLSNDREGPTNESSQTLTVIGVSAASSQGGTVSLTSGVVRYTPAPDFSGLDTFSYTTRDDGLTNGAADPQTSLGTVTVTVFRAETNDPPVALGDVATTREDSATSIAASLLTANDSRGPADESGQTLTLTSVSTTSAEGGSVSFAGGVVTYTPGPDFFGTDRFTYVVRDDGITDGVADPRQSVGTVTVTVLEVNDAPVAASDSARTGEDSALSMSAASLVANDYPGAPGEGDQLLTVTSVSATSAQGGTVTLTAGMVSYRPAANFTGDDSFTYLVGDNGTTGGAPDPLSATGTVTIKVNEVNDAPVAVDDAMSTPEDNAKDFAASVLTSNDSRGAANEGAQTLTVSAVSPTSAQGGTVTLAAGRVSYRPAPDFNGSDSFTYTVSNSGTTDGVSDPKTASATVTMTVVAVNDAPVASGDARTTAEDTAIEFAAGTLTDNDNSGPANESGQQLTVSDVATTSSARGTVSLVAGKVRYTPAPDFFGSDTFTYTVADDGVSNGVADPKRATGVVTVTVGAINDAPTLDAIADPAAVLEDAGPLVVVLTGIGRGASNESAQSLTITATSSAPTLVPNPSASDIVGGQAVGSASGLLAEASLVLTPTPNASGSALITVTVSDDGGTAGGGRDAVVRTFTIVVVAQNDAPTVDAIADPPPILEDSGPQSLILTGVGAGAPDEASQVVVLSARSSNPTLVPDPTTSTITGATAQIEFRPAANVHGTAAITLTLEDDGGTQLGGVATTVRSFEVAVIAVNDAPTFDAIVDPPADPTVIAADSENTLLLTGISPGPVDEAGQVVSFSAFSDNPAVMAQVIGAVSPTGTATLTYAAGQIGGSAHITVTARDDGGSANGGSDTFSRTFTVVVNAPPVSGRRRLRAGRRLAAHGGARGGRHGE